MCWRAAMNVSSRPARLPNSPHCASSTLVQIFIPSDQVQALGALIGGWEIGVTMDEIPFAGDAAVDMRDAIVIEV